MTTTTRTDIHRPSAIQPEHYEWVGEFYQGMSEEVHVEYARDHRDLEAALGDDWATVKGGNYDRNRTCDHCGTAFAYGSVYRHVPTGDIIAVGHTCAANTMLPGVDQAARHRAAVAKAVEAAKQAKVNADARAAVLDANPGLAEALNTEHYIVEDIARRFRGPKAAISDKQIALVFKIAADVADRERRDAEFRATATPVVEGRGPITGEVLTTKWVDSDYGSTFKMLVLDDRGFKVWGTVPSSLGSIPVPADDEDARINAERAEKGWEPIPPRTRGVERGDRVAFTATVEASRDDEFFGYFKRPTKATIIEQVAVVEATPEPDADEIEVTVTIDEPGPHDTRDNPYLSGVGPS